MSHIIKIDDDQLDEIIRAELQFQRDCCEPAENDLIEAFNKVIEVFTPPSEIVAKEIEQQVSYMYGKWSSLDPIPEQNVTTVSYHFGV